jgi:transposase
LKGNTPTLEATSNRERLSLISAIVEPDDFCFQVHRQSIVSDTVIDFFKQMLKEFTGHLTVILDRARIHKAKKVKAFFKEQAKRLAIEYFPVAAPELNPDENVWSYLKYDRLSNFCPKTIAGLEQTVKRELRKIKRNKSLVASFVRETKL